MIKEKPELPFDWRSLLRPELERVAREADLVPFVEPPDWLWLIILELLKADRYQAIKNAYVTWVWVDRVSP